MTDSSNEHPSGTTESPSDDSNIKPQASKPESLRSGMLSPEFYGQSKVRESYLTPAQPTVQTGAEKKAVSRAVEQSVFTPEFSVMLVTAHAHERNVLRTYFRSHEVPCRAAIHAEHAVQLAFSMKPGGILLSGSQFSPEEILTLVEDLSDLTPAPILLLLTDAQAAHLRDEHLEAHVMQYPASLRQIREELSLILDMEADASERCSLRAIAETTEATS